MKSSGFRTDEKRAAGENPDHFISFPGKLCGSTQRGSGTAVSEMIGKRGAGRTVEGGGCQVRRMIDPTAARSDLAGCGISVPVPVVIRVDFWGFPKVSTVW